MHSIVGNLQIERGVGSGLSFNKVNSFFGGAKNLFWVFTDVVPPLISVVFVVKPTVFISRNPIAFVIPKHRWIYAYAPFAKVCCFVAGVNLFQYLRNGNRGVVVDMLGAHTNADHSKTCRSLSKLNAVT